MYREHSLHMNKLTLFGYIWMAVSMIATLIVFAMDNGVERLDIKVDGVGSDTLMTSHLINFTTPFTVCLVSLAIGFACISAGRWGGKK